MIQSKRTDWIIRPLLEDRLAHAPKGLEFLIGRLLAQSKYFSLRDFGGLCGSVTPFGFNWTRAISYPFCYGLTNTNVINSPSLREAERRSNPNENEIAAPFGLAMTRKDI